ncbi:MAG: NAD-dependent succinate-semialdehyde dehydrogenase [Thermoplasmata archaeon]
MKFETINPATGNVLRVYETMSRDAVFDIAQACHAAFLKWRDLDVRERGPYLRRLADVLRKNTERYARLITSEMGKPITESRAEIEKCALAAEVFADRGPEWLRDESLEADGKMHVVSYEPLGVVLSVMPWNFPFWQALRFAIPTILAGNVSILKHSNTVPECALAIEEAFGEAGFPENTFRAVIADHATVEELVSSDVVQGVSLTGSTETGMKIGETAGKSLKKVVMELGGSDPFIVLDDANIDLAAKSAASARAQNTGQSCIAAKRFIVMEGVAGEFAQAFAGYMSQLVVGDPMEEETQVGPLVNAAAADDMQALVQDALDKGAKLVTGGKRVEGNGYFVEPTLLTGVGPDMRVVAEESFCPVAPIIVVKDEEEAISVANDSEFGLGGSVWTKDLEKGMRVARRIEAGTLFVNAITKSDPRMPFGGIKKSGLGRELSKFGIREFVNVKALNVYEQATDSGPHKGGE